MSYCNLSNFVFWTDVGELGYGLLFKTYDKKNMALKYTKNISRFLPIDSELI